MKAETQMSYAASVARPARANIIATWILKILLALAFLAAAGAKLAGVPMMIQVFDQIGFGQWFRIFTAIVEIAGALGLFIPGLTAIAALWLGMTMVGAFLAHIFLLHTSPTGAIVLFVLSLTLVWLRRDQLVVGQFEI
jgi:uncharacterized membrane protein YphA (DoxX/SURF4 family)